MTAVATARPWRAFLVIAIGVFLSVLDLFIVNIAFPALRLEFATASLTELSWVLNAYAIVFAALLVPAGKLGDLYGRRRMFLIGLVLFLTGSALSATAGSLAFLIGARVIQAAGGAAMTPNSLGVILPIFPPQRRAAVIGAWAAIGGVGAAAGPVLGGLLTQVSWRWIFLVNLPLGIVALLLVPRLVAEIRQEGETRFPDVLGAGLLMASIGLLTLALSQGPDWDWDARVMASLAASAVLGAVFLGRSSRHPAPVVELSMLAVRSFALASLATVFFFAAFAALLVSNVLFLTGVWRFSVLEAGFALVPGPAMAAIFAGLAGRGASRFGPGRIGGIGGLMFATSAWYLTLLGSDPSYLLGFLPAQIVGGAGIGLTLPALTAIAVAELPPTRLATGIGVQTMFRQIGAALGVAIWVATVGGAAALRSVDDFRPGWVFLAVMALASGLVLLATVSIRRPVANTDSRAASQLETRESA